MFRRSLLISTTALAALALPAGSALAVGGSLSGTVSAPSTLDAAVTGTASIPSTLDASLNGTLSAPSTATGSVSGSVSAPSTNGSVSGTVSAPSTDTLSGMTADGSATADSSAIDTLSESPANGSATGSASTTGGSATGAASVPSTASGSASGSASVPAPAVTLNVSSPKRAVNGCVGGTKASVTGQGVTSVAFYLDGQKVKTDTTSNASGAYTLKVSCQRVRAGASGTAVVNFDAGGTSLQGTMPFTVG